MKHDDVESPSLKNEDQSVTMFSCSFSGGHCVVDTVSGTRGNCNPAVDGVYCAKKWSCIRTADFGHSRNFWGALGAQTGWLHGCRYSGGGCKGPTLAAFSPYAGGGLMNSVGGPYGNEVVGWGEVVHLVCGRELP
jgi:hypothetical protein